MAEPEKFYAIRRTDGELMWDEYGWMGCEGPNDWTVAEESEHDDPLEYEIVLMHVESVAKRTFGDPLELHERVVVRAPADPNFTSIECDYCGEPWPCEFVQEAAADA